MITAAIIIGILIILILGISYYSYRMAFYSGAKNPAEYKLKLPKGEIYQREYDRAISYIKVLNEMDYEKVRIKAHDGTPLAARYYHVSDGAPVHIEFHGYRSRATTDFCGINVLVRELGHNTLLVDQRAHGESGGKTISFGIKERLDCLDWINYTLDRFGKDTKIILSGLSMGAATVLMASELELPQNVVGIMADCPYSSPKEIIMKVGKDMHFPPRLMLPFVWLGGFLFGQFNLFESSALEAIKTSEIPILILHGDADELVPCEMSQSLQTSGAKDITVELFEKAGHGLSYIISPENYEKAVLNFVNRCLT